MRDQPAGGGGRGRGAGFGVGQGLTATPGPEPVPATPDPATIGPGTIGAPVLIHGRVAPSRVLFGPHTTNLGSGRALSARHVAYYARRAAGGAGVIVVETASVHASDHPYERAPLAVECAPGWTEIAAACGPALVLASLGHAGSQGSSGYTRHALWGASRVADPGTREVPMIIDGSEIDALVAGFAAAARLAVDAGSAGVEIEAGQRSLLRQFLSGLTNHRVDGYGRDRARLLREVLTAVRAAIGDAVLGLRLCCDELAPWAGITPATAVMVIAGVADLVDYVVPVRGSALSVGATRPATHERPEPLLRPGLGVPLVRQGSVVDPGAAQSALDDGWFLVEMTRALVADPDLVEHVRAGVPERIRPCTLTNRWFDVVDPRNAIVSDDAEPRSGHETVDPPVDGRGRTPGPSPGAAGAFRAPGAPGVGAVLVVGGGPAGLEAARMLALRGHRVRLAEREAELGGALRWAARLPGRERFALLVAWWERELARLGVQVELGAEVREPAGATLLATGGRAGPGVGVEVATFLRVGGRPAGSVVVHDPFPDGTATAVAQLIGPGAVLVTPDPVAAADSGGDLAPANARLVRAGVERAVLSRLVGTGGGVATLEHVWTGARREVPCALVVDCGPRLPDDALARAFPGLLRAGDCVAPRTVHAAVREGRRAAARLDGARS